jgi:hypothetical protein
MITLFILFFGFINNNRSPLKLNNNMLEIIFDI